MIRRSTAIVLVIFIILVFTAWYFHQDRNNEPIDETITSTPAINIFSINIDSLLRVQIKETNGDRLILERDSQGIWSFIEPTGFEIDQAEAQSIADNILGLKVLAGLEKYPSLDVIGLDKPRYQITLTANAGEEQVAIIGNLTPTSSGYYVSRMGQIPAIVSKYNLDAIIDTILNPPIYITPTPSVTPAILETQIPQDTQTP